MRALIYLRVSTPGQAKQENPIETQREVCLEHARKLDYFVDETTDIYIDGGLTGRNDDRDAFREMNKRLKSDSEITIVIAYDMSRIFRNGIEYFKYKNELEKYGKRFVSVTEHLGNDGTPADFLVEWMLAGVHEFRSRQDGQKIRDGMLTKARSGKYVGYAPFGYKNSRELIMGGKDRRWMTTNTKEAPWVTTAAEEYARGSLSLRELSGSLNQRGFPTRSGRPLTPGGLEKILKNKIYTGWVCWGGIETPHGEHEKLIDEDTFYRVQAIFEARNYGANRKRKHFFLGRGVSYCEECNSRWTAGYHKNGRYGYYSCQKKIGPNPTLCKQSSIPLNVLEEMISKLFSKVQISDHVAEKIRTQVRLLMSKEQEVQEKVRKGLVASIDTIATSKKRLLEKYVTAHIGDDEYEAFKSDLETREAKHKSELVSIEANLSRITKVIETAVGLANSCQGAYARASYEQKAILIQAFFERILIKDGTIVAAMLNEPFDFIYENKARKDPVFQLATSSGDVGNRTPVQSVTNTACTVIGDLVSVHV